MAEQMMTGNAEAYFHELTRWMRRSTTPLRRARTYSVKHCRNRIIYGSAISKGTRYTPPQARLGLMLVEEWPVKNMHTHTERSPRTLAYDVKASARRISANRRSGWIPPIRTRRNILQQKERLDLVPQRINQNSISEQPWIRKTTVWTWIKSSVP